VIEISRMMITLMMLRGVNCINGQFSCGRLKSRSASSFGLALYQARFLLCNHLSCDSLLVLDNAANQQSDDALVVKVRTVGGLHPLSVILRQTIYLSRSLRAIFFIIGEGAIGYVTVARIARLLPPDTIDRSSHPWGSRRSDHDLQHPGPVSQCSSRKTQGFYPAVDGKTPISKGALHQNRDGTCSDLLIGVI